MRANSKLCRGTNTATNHTQVHPTTISFLRKSIPKNSTTATIKMTALTLVSNRNLSASSENARSLKRQNSQLLCNGLTILIPTLCLDLFHICFVIPSICFTFFSPPHHAPNFSSLQQFAPLVLNWIHSKHPET